MAARDFNFSKFLIEALRYKLTPQGKIDTYYGNGRYSLPYSGQSGIFYFARRYFPKIYDTNHKLTKTNSEQDQVANLAYAEEIVSQIDRHKDPDLEVYQKRETVPTEPESFHQEVEAAVTEHIQNLSENPQTHKFSGAIHQAPIGGGLNTIFGRKYKTTQPATDKAERLKEQKRSNEQTLIGSELPKESILKTPQPTLSKQKLKIPSLAKDVGVAGKIAARKIVTRTPGFIAPFFKDIFGKGGGSILSAGGGVLGSKATYSTLNFSRSPLGFIGGGFASRASGGLTAAGGKKVLLVGLVFLLSMAFLFAFFFSPPKIPGINQPGDATSPDGQNQLIIEKSGPQNVVNGGQIRYQINATYKGPGKATNVNVKDRVPDGTRFIDSSDGTKPDTNNLLNWVIPEINSNQTWSVSIIVEAVEKDFWVINQATATYTPGGGGIVSGDIASCQFKRGDQNPQFRSINSSDLLGYIQEASNLSGIPPQVLAAFIRVETPTTTTYNNEQLANAFCPVSSTGALGIMQLQPSGTTGHCKECINLGASYLGKTVDTLTNQDYCSPKSSVILGAGFIIKKMEYLGFANNGKWNPEWTTNKEAINKMVEGYYGCLKYPSCQSGPFNYGDDVWESINACQPQPTQSINNSPNDQQTISN